MANPIKAIGGGIQGIKNTQTAIKGKNAAIKNGTAPQGFGPNGTTIPNKKQSMTLNKVVGSFVHGVQDPKGAKSLGKDLKAMKPTKPTKPGK